MSSPFFANQRDWEKWSRSANKRSVTGIISPTTLSKPTIKQILLIIRKTKVVNSPQSPFLFLIFILEAEKQLKNQILEQKSWKSSNFDQKHLQPIRFLFKSCSSSQILNWNFQNASDFELKIWKKMRIWENFALKKSYFDWFYPVKPTNFAIWVCFENHQLWWKIFWK